MNDTALAALHRARPMLHGIVTAGEALGLGHDTLLHAGPPLARPEAPCAPLAASLELALVHDRGIDAAAANALIIGRGVELAPAQSFGVATPLAHVVSAATPLWRVRSGNDMGYAPLGAVGGPDLRVGKRDPVILERLRDRDLRLRPVLEAALALEGPIDLLEIALGGLAAGDDLHASSVHATGLLAAELHRRLRLCGPALEAQRVWLAESLARTPLFFLTPWMAACRAMAAGMEATGEGTLVTRLAGNGEAVGIALSGNAQTWHCLPATAPVGPRLPGVSVDAPVLGAIGDSGIVDALGFGGMVLHLAGDTRPQLEPFLAPDTPSDLQALLCQSHPALAAIGARSGLDAQQVVSRRLAPAVAISMLDAGGTLGILGRGIFRPPVALFEAALAEPLLAGAPLARILAKG